jgi:hypothetical protein
MKSTIFWDVTPCSSLSVIRRFRGIYSLHLQGCHMLSRWFLALSLFFRPWRWRRYVPPKRRLTLNGPHGVISQKMVLLWNTLIRICEAKTRWNLFQLLSGYSRGLSIELLMGFWTCPSSEQDTTFRKLDLFPSSGERIGRHLLSLVHQKELLSITGQVVSINWNYISL